jgi:hypothetical protein
MSVQGHLAPLVCFLDFIEEVDGIGDKWSGDTTTVFNMSLQSACFIDETFFSQKQNFQPWNYSPQVPDYWDF